MIIPTCHVFVDEIASKGVVLHVLVFEGLEQMPDFLYTPTQALDRSHRLQFQKVLITLFGVKTIGECEGSDKE